MNNLFNFVPHDLQHSENEFKALGRGGVINGPMEKEQNIQCDPNFWSIDLNVLSNISATTEPILYFDGVFEAPDP